jgi:hypothetical protein
MKATWILAAGNCVLWIAWIGNFLVLSRPYTPHQKTFEEDSPSYIFWGRAFPPPANTSPIIRTVRLVEFPSFFIAIPVNYFFSSRGIVVDHLYGGISAGGYYLIAVFLLSFVQWYAIGWLLDWARKGRVRLGGTDGQTTGNSRGVF